MKITGLESRLKKTSTDLETVQAKFDETKQAYEITWKENQLNDLQVNQL